MRTIEQHAQLYQTEVVWLAVVFGGLAAGTVGQLVNIKSKTFLHIIEDATAVTSHTVGLKYHGIKPL